MSKDYWVIQTGQKMKPKEFEDQHLLNTIKFIEFRAPHWKAQDEIDAYATPEPMGDGASYEFGASLIRLERMSVETWLSLYYPIYGLLKKEAKKRKLL